MEFFLIPQKSTTRTAGGGALFVFLDASTNGSMTKNKKARTGGGLKVNNAGNVLRKKNRFKQKPETISKKH